MLKEEARKGRSIWLPPELDSLIKNRAESLGLSYNNIIVDALHKTFGIPRDPLSILIENVRFWLLSEYSPKDFPEDVILQAFRYIQSQPVLMKNYNSIIESTPKARSRAQATLNRRIGQAVTSILKGRVTIRKIKARNCILIKGYSKLKPTLT